MSRSLWAVFLAAIFTIAGAQLPGSPSSVEGAESALARIGGVHQLTKTTHATANNTVSVKLSDLPIGKVIQVGTVKFIKVGADQYLSLTGCVDPVLTTTGTQKLLTYTGNYQSYTFYAGCDYQIELWGASGGYALYQNYVNKGLGGLGGYTSGNISMSTTRTMYFYIGGQGADSKYQQNSPGGWNGGGYGTKDSSDDETSGGGGGATDLRIVAGEYNNAVSLNSRIMVAGAGSGGVYDYPGNAAGGLTGYTSRSGVSAGTQVSGYNFGVGQNGLGTGLSCGDVGNSGGGAGYYGGTATNTATCSCNCYNFVAGSGSSYISGHTGCVAIAEGSTSNPRTTRVSGCTTGTTNQSCSIHYSQLQFTSTVMIDGKGLQWTNAVGSAKLMPNPNGGNDASGAGHSGHGYARITRLH